MFVHYLLFIYVVHPPFPLASQYFQGICHILWSSFFWGCQRTNFYHENWKFPRNCWPYDLSGDCLKRFLWAFVVLYQPKTIGNSINACLLVKILSWKALLWFLENLLQDQTHQVSHYEWESRTRFWSLYHTLWLRPAFFMLLRSLWLQSIFMSILSHNLCLVWLKFWCSMPLSDKKRTYTNKDIRLGKLVSRNDASAFELLRLKSIFTQFSVVATL